MTWHDPRHGGIKKIENFGFFFFEIFVTDMTCDTSSVTYEAVKKNSYAIFEIWKKLLKKLSKYSVDFYKIILTCITTMGGDEETFVMECFTWPSRIFLAAYIVCAERVFFGFGHHHSGTFTSDVFTNIGFGRFYGGRWRNIHQWYFARPSKISLAARKVIFVHRRVFSGFGRVPITGGDGGIFTSDISPDPRKYP